MVSQTYDLKSLLEQGTYDEAGQAQTSTTCVRTGQMINYEPALYNAEFELEAVLALPMGGSPSGEDDLKIPALSQLSISVYLDDPNYKIEYYWFTIEREGYDDGHDGNYWRVGSCALVIPVVGGNKENELPIIYGVQNAAYTGSGSGGRSTRYIECDVGGNYLKYSDNGTIYETTVAQFILGSVLHFDEDTDTYIATRQAYRNSEFVQAEAALIGYGTNNATRFNFNERWITSGDVVNLAEYIPTPYVKAVIRVDESTEIKPDYITKATLKAENSSWELLDSGNIYTYPIPSSIETNVFVEPYPATFWYLNRYQKLDMFLLPDEPGGSFTGCSSLAYVSIPESVKLIGYRAFAGTAITKVRIARDCVYDETSFPAGCEIWYYDEEPEVVDYGALISDLTARVAALEENQ